MWSAPESLQNIPPPPVRGWAKGFLLMGCWVRAFCLSKTGHRWSTECPLEPQAKLNTGHAQKGQPQPFISPGMSSELGKPQVLPPGP